MRWLSSKTALALAGLRYGGTHAFPIESIRTRHTIHRKNLSVRYCARTLSLLIWNHAGSAESLDELGVVLDRAVEGLIKDEERRCGTG